MSLDYQPLKIANWQIQDISSNADNEYIITTTKAIPTETESFDVSYNLDITNDHDGDSLEPFVDSNVIVTGTIAYHNTEEHLKHSISVKFGPADSLSTAIEKSGDTYYVDISGISLLSSFPLPRDTETNTLLLTLLIKSPSNTLIKTLVHELIIDYTPEANIAYVNTPQGIYRGSVSTASFEFYQTTDIQDYLSVLEDITLYNISLSTARQAEILENSTATIKTIYWYAAPDITETQFVEATNVPMERATDVNWMVNNGYIKPDLYSYTQVELTLSFANGSPLSVQQIDNGVTKNSNLITKKIAISQLFTIDEVYSTTNNAQLTNLAAKPRYYSDTLNIRQSSTKFLSQINAYYTTNDNTSGNGNVYHSTLPALTELVHQYASFNISYSRLSSENGALTLSAQADQNNLTLTNYNAFSAWTQPSEISVTYNWNPEFTWNNGSIVNKFGQNVNSAVLNSEDKFNLAQAYYNIIFSVENVSEGYSTYNVTNSTNDTSHNTRLLSSRSFNIQPVISEFKFLATVLNNPTAFVESTGAFTWDQDVFGVGDLREYSNTSNNTFNQFNGFADGNSVVFLTRAYPSGLVENFPLDNAQMQIQFTAIAKYRGVLNHTQFVYLSQTGMTGEKVQAWNPYGVSPSTSINDSTVTFNENGLYKLNYSETDSYGNIVNQKLVIQTSNDAVTSFTVSAGTSVDICGNQTSGYFLDKDFIQDAINNMEFINPLDSGNQGISATSDHYNLDASDNDDHKYFFNNVLISDLSLVIVPLNNDNASYEISIPLEQHATLKNYFSSIVGNWTPPNDASGIQLLFTKEVKFTVSTEDSDANGIVASQVITLNNINIQLGSAAFVTPSSSLTLTADPNFNGSSAMYSIGNKLWTGNEGEKLDIKYNSQYGLVYQLTNDGNNDSHLQLSLINNVPADDPFGSITFFNALNPAPTNYTSTLDYNLADLGASIAVTFTAADESGMPMTYSVSRQTVTSIDTELFALANGSGEGVDYSISMQKRSIDFTTQASAGANDTITGNNDVNVTLTKVADPTITGPLTGNSTNLDYFQNNESINKGTVNVTITSYFNFVYSSLSTNNYQTNTNVSGNNGGSATELINKTFSSPPLQLHNNLSYSYSYNDWTHFFNTNPNSLKTDAAAINDISFNVPRTQAPRPFIVTDSIPVDVSFDLVATNEYKFSANWLEEALGTGTTIRAWSGILNSSDTVETVVREDNGGNISFNNINKIVIVKDPSGNDGIVDNSINIVTSGLGNVQLINGNLATDSDNVLVEITDGSLNNILANPILINTTIAGISTVQFKSEIVKVLIDLSYSAPTPWVNGGTPTLVGSSGTGNPYDISGLVDASSTQILEDDILINVVPENDLGNNQQAGPLILNQNVNAISGVAATINNGTFSITINNDVDLPNYTAVTNNSKLDWDATLTNSIFDLDANINLLGAESPSSSFNYLNNVDASNRVISYIKTDISSVQNGSYYYGNLDNSTNVVSSFTHNISGSNSWSYNKGVKATLDQLRYGTYNPGIYYVVIMMRVGADFSEEDPVEPTQITTETRSITQSTINTTTHVQCLKVKVTTNLTLDEIVWNPDSKELAFPSTFTATVAGGGNPVTLTQFLLVDSLFTQSNQYAAFDIFSAEGSLVNYTTVNVNASAVYYPDYYGANLSAAARINPVTSSDSWTYTIDDIQTIGTVQKYTQKSLLKMFTQNLVRKGNNTVPGVYTYDITFNNSLSFVNGGKVEPNGLVTDPFDNSPVERRFVLKVQDTNEPVLVIPGVVNGQLALVAGSTATNINRTFGPNSFATTNNNGDNVYSDNISGAIPYMTERNTILFEIASSKVYIKSVYWIETDDAQNVVNFVSIYSGTTNEYEAGQLSQLNIKFPTPADLAPNLNLNRCKLYVEYEGTAQEGNDSYTSIRKTVIFGNENKNSGDIDFNNKSVNLSGTSVGLDETASTIQNRFSFLIGN